MYVQVKFVRNGLVYVNKLHGIRARFNQLNQIRILSVSVSVALAHYSLGGTAQTYVSASDHTKPELFFPAKTSSAQRLKTEPFRDQQMTS